MMPFLKFDAYGKAITWGNHLGIATPVAWWALNNWLQNFAYHINISWWTFVLAAVAALMIVLLTVSFRAIKAAWLTAEEH